MTLTPPREDMEDVRCRGCRRLLAIGPQDFRAYCDDQCATDFPATAAEGRDALIEAIWQKTSRAKTALARDFGMSRQRIDQILAARNLKTPPVVRVRVTMTSVD